VLAEASSSSCMINEDAMDDALSVDAAVSDTLGLSPNLIMTASSGSSQFPSMSHSSNQFKREGQMLWYG
jgi:hypothetical protein